MSTTKKEKVKPIVVGISIGDINGIGIETLIKAFSDKRMLENVQVIVYGHPDFISHYKKQLDFQKFNFNTIGKAEEALPRKVNVVKMDLDDRTIEMGKSTTTAGNIAFKSLEAASSDLAANKVDVLVTLPINKDNIQGEQFNFPGHTEYLAKMANVDEHLMLLCDGGLRVGVATGHISLKEIPAALTKELILSKLNVMNNSLIRDFGVNRPKIAVLGLNPHAGDQGLLGDEEKEIITPAIREAQSAGILAFGPYGADGFFGTLNHQNFDGVLAMYHDQGLIPFKTLAFENGVNYTAGLPIVRTSPDHGTAFGIAGQNIANEQSMRSAIYMAVDIVRNRTLS